MTEQRGRRLSTKLMLALVFFAVLNLISVSLIVGIDYYYAEKEECSDSAFAIARAAAEFIDGDRVPDYLNPVGTDENGKTVYYTDSYYDEVMRYLTSLQTEYSLMEYYYVFVPRGDEIIYVWDADTANCPSRQGSVESYSDEMREAVGRVLGSDRVEEIFLSDDRTWGFLATAYYPIYNSAGEAVAIVGADLSADRLAHVFLHYFLLIVIPILIVTVASAGIVYSRIKRNLVRPIEKLNAATRSLVDGLDGDGRFDLEIHTGNELEELAGSFQKMNDDLREYIRRLSTVTAEHERINAQFDIARQIQSDIIPNAFPAFPERKDFDIFAALNPCREIGGDFYDFFLVDSDHLAMVMGDVSDKGVPAALYMVMAQAMIKNQTLRGFTPAQVLQNVNEQMLENRMELYSATWLAVLELSTGKGIAVNAGHQHPILCRAGKKFELYRYHHSPPVGAIETVRFQDHGFQLMPGDTLFIHSDGVRDAGNGRGEFFGTRRILAALNREPEATPAVLLQTVRSDVRHFAGGADQDDDLVMLALKYYGPDGAAD